MTASPRKVLLAVPDAIALETPFTAACAAAALSVRMVVVTMVEPATMLAIETRATATPATLAMLVRKLACAAASNSPSDRVSSVITVTLATSEAPGDKGGGGGGFDGGGGADGGWRGGGNGGWMSTLATATALEEMPARLARELARLDESLRAAALVDVELSGGEGVSRIGCEVLNGAH